MIFMFIHNAIYHNKTEKLMIVLNEQWFRSIIVNCFQKLQFFRKLHSKIYLITEMFAEKKDACSQLNAKMVQKLWFSMTKIKFIAQVSMISGERWLLLEYKTDNDCGEKKSDNIEYVNDWLKRNCSDSKWSIENCVRASAVEMALKLCIQFTFWLVSIHLKDPFICAVASVQFRGLFIPIDHCS